MRWLPWGMLALVLTGCHAFSTDVDGRIEERASGPIDMPAVLPESLPAPMQRPDVRHVNPAPKVVARFGAIVPASGSAPGQPDKKPTTMLDRLQPSEAMLGFKVPDVQMPGPKASDAEKEAFLRKQFPPLPPAPQLPPARLGEDGRPLTLSDLQQIALRTNPQIRQAHQDIESARGAALQAGLYPNPSIGYEASSVGQGDPNGVRSSGQQGGFVEQTIVTAGKLSIAREAARREVEINEQKLRATEADVQAQVRRGYFAVLSAQKNYDSTLALAQLSDELYQVLLLQMKAGEVAAYEPMQIRVLAMQARGNLVLAHNRYVSAWKQLAATLGTPGMPLTALTGRIDMAVPHFEHDAVLDCVLANHSDVIAAQHAVDKARLLARLEEVQPYPNPTVHVAFQKDFTTAPFGTVANINVGVPVPFWNRNQGNIQSARAALARALDENHRVRNELTAKVAAAFERYENNRTLLEMYRTQILPNQVQAFRASVARHAAVGDKQVSYNDLVNAQQSLAGLTNSYLGALSGQWDAVVDIAHLLQTRDLFQSMRHDEVAPIPDLGVPVPRTTELRMK